MQDVLIDIEEEDDEDLSSNATFATAKSGNGSTLSEAVSQSETVAPDEAVLASDSSRRSEALSQGALASAELEAGIGADDSMEKGDDGKSGQPSVSRHFEH